jgi:hypothetical protein
MHHFCLRERRHQSPHYSHANQSLRYGGHGSVFHNHQQNKGSKKVIKE